MVTADTVAVNPTLDELAGTVTKAGTETAVLLLESEMSTPALPVAALSVTVQESVPAPVMDELVHETELSVASPAAPDSV